MQEKLLLFYIQHTKFLLLAIKVLYLHYRNTFMSEIIKKERTVIHVYLIETDKHYYFGSIANIYEHFSLDQIGISYGTLRNYGLTQDKPFVNNKCIIRKGVLLSKRMSVTRIKNK